MDRRFLVAVTAVLVLGVLAGGARPWGRPRISLVRPLAAQEPSATPPPTPSPPAATPTPAPSPPAAAPLTYTRVDDPVTGLSFDVPAAWARDGDQAAWRPAAGDSRRLSVQNLAAGPGVESRSLLPAGAQTILQQPIDLGWAAGTVYDIAIAAPTPDGQGMGVRERHVLIPRDATRTLDFSITGAAGADLSPLRQALDHLLRSVAPLGSSSPSAAGTTAASGTSTPTPATRDEAAASLAAALRALDAVTAERCGADNPRNRPCLTPRSSPEQAGRGAAAFDVSDPGGGPTSLAVMGRDASGDWKPWFSTRATPYQRYTLPGELRVCADGDGLNLRARPNADAAVITLLPDGSTITAEEFVLTEPATTNPPHQGYGWYRITAPRPGWAYGKYLASAEQGDCTLRDQSENPTP